MKNAQNDDEITEILSRLSVNATIYTIKYSYYSKGIKCAALGIGGVLILYVMGMILVMLGGFK
ncbi:hypothetical protein ACS47_02850 [Bacillus cereus]|nr:hypothetical protein ACS47_02850 [Bacillus cereus]